MTLLALAMNGCGRTQEVAQKPKEEVPKGPVAYKISYPLGLDSESANIPKDNPLTEEKLKLGKRPLTIHLWRATRVPWAKRHSAVICCSRIRLSPTAKLATWLQFYR